MGVCSAQDVGCKQRGCSACMVLGGKGAGNRELPLLQLVLCGIAVASAASWPEAWCSYRGGFFVCGHVCAGLLRVGCDPDQEEAVHPGHKELGEGQEAVGWRGERFGTGV